MQRCKAGLQLPVKEIIMAKRFHSGSGDHANMPTEVKVTTYNNPHQYMAEGLDDGISGIDKQIAEDAGKRNKHTKPKKV